METLLECSLPQWVLAKILRPMPRGLFIIVSGLLMAVLHLVSLMAVINAFITGAFIAYVYCHALRRGHGTAILHATVFHSAINLVGWVVLMLNRHGA
jgi:membrane protease YdiL (CAAX protease family)